MYVENVFIKKVQVWRFWQIKTKSYEITSLSTNSGVGLSKNTVDTVEYKCKIMVFEMISVHSLYNLSVFSQINQWSKLQIFAFWFSVVVLRKKNCMAVKYLEYVRCLQEILWLA